MGIDETRKEFDRVTELTAKGAGEMESRSLDQAQSTYFEALKLIDTLGLSLVRIECLERLADSYYASKKFLEASTVYGQLVAALVSPERWSPGKPSWRKAMLCSPKSMRLMPTCFAAIGKIRIC